MTESLSNVPSWVENLETIFQLKEETVWESLRGTLSQTDKLCFIRNNIMNLIITSVLVLHCNSLFCKFSSILEKVYS